MRRNLLLKCFARVTVTSKQAGSISCRGRAHRGMGENRRGVSDVKRRPHTFAMACLAANAMSGVSAG